jgi:hypothetical protein
MAAVALLLHLWHSVCRLGISHSMHGPSSVLQHCSSLDLTSIGQACSQQALCMQHELRLPQPRATVGGDKLTHFSKTSSMAW